MRCSSRDESEGTLRRTAIEIPASPHTGRSPGSVPNRYPETGSRRDGSREPCISAQPVASAPLFQCREAWMGDDNQLASSLPCENCNPLTAHSPISAHSHPLWPVPDPDTATWMSEYRR